MMNQNHCVPDFEMEEDSSAPTAEGSSSAKKPATGEAEVMELLWQNGQVVVQSQNQGPPKRSSYGGVGGGGEIGIHVEREIRSNGVEEQQHLFMQEDEMATWLNYPLEEPPFDREFYTDLLYAAPPPPATISTITQPTAAEEIRSTAAAPLPPIPPAVTKPDNSSRVHNFGHFSRLPRRPGTEAMSKPFITTARESTVVESNETPILRTESRISQNVADSRPPVRVNGGTATAAGKSAVSAELPGGKRDITVTSSLGASVASFSASGEPSKARPMPPPAAEDRKRKSIETDDNEGHSEDIEYETGEAKKQATKRSRAAQVHNLSERRRRDRINEKMRALQELIPCCNKSDKASMLDEAIEYLKSLQLQVQMMSIGCGMVPMMYPRMPQYMPTMGMDMGMNRLPMVAYPGMLLDSAMPSSSAMANMGPRFPMPPFHMPLVPGQGPCRSQRPNHSDPVLNPAIANNPNQPQIPNFVDPYQQFIVLHQAQLQVTSQNQAEPSPGTRKPCTRKDPINPDNDQEAGEKLDKCV